MKTTAEYRRLAARYESELLWTRAAEAWEMAIENYPVSARGLGQMGRLDIARMQRRADACHAMTTQRMQEIA